MAGPPDENVPAATPQCPAREWWPQLAGVQVRFRGTFAYVTGTTTDGEDLPLMRLRYGGSASM